MAAKGHGSKEHLRGVIGAVFLCLLLALPAGAAKRPLAVTYEIEAITEGVTRDADGFWLVPLGERVEWQVVWTVTNTALSTVRDVTLRNNYSAEIEVDPRSITGSRGHVEARRLGQGRGATQVLWSIGDLPSGSSASLTFRIHTGLNPAGKQHYNDPGEYCLDSALTIWWQGGSSSFPCLPVRVRENDWLRVEVPFTRKDWRVRQAGEYASLALQLRIASNSSVMVQFYGFLDLTMEGPDGSAPASLATWYATGETLAAASQRGWWTAAALNEQRFPFTASPALEEGVDWYLWERIQVTPGHPSGEYRTQGTVRLILANANVRVVDEEPR